MGANEFGVGYGMSPARVVQECDRRLELLERGAGQENRLETMRLQVVRRLYTRQARRLLWDQIRHDERMHGIHAGIAEEHQKRAQQLLEEANRLAPAPAEMEGVA